MPNCVLRFLRGRTLLHLDRNKGSGVVEWNANELKCLWHNWAGWQIKRNLISKATWISFNTKYPATGVKAKEKFFFNAFQFHFTTQTTHHKLCLASVNQQNNLETQPSLLLLNCMKWIPYWCISWGWKKGKTLQQHKQQY